MAHLGVGHADDPIRGHSLPQTKPPIAAAVGVGLGVGLDDLGQQPDRLGHRRVAHLGQLGHDRPGRPHQPAQMGPAGRPVLPVDIGLGPAKRFGRRRADRDSRSPPARAAWRKNPRISS